MRSLFDKILGRIGSLSVKTLAIIGVLVLGIIISALFFGYHLTAAFFIAYLSKVLSGYTRRGTESFGIEFLTVSVVLVGVHYGPTIAFVFGFVVLAIIDLVSWFINPPFEATWPPVIPGPDTLIDGLIGVVAGIIGNSLPFTFAVLVCVVIKNILVPVKDSLIYGMPIKPVFIFNIVISVVVARLVEIFVL